jgi:hypothetical protein
MNEAFRKAMMSKRRANKKALEVLGLSNRIECETIWCIVQDLYCIDNIRRSDVEKCWKILTPRKKEARPHVWTESTDLPNVAVPYYAIQLLDGTLIGGNASQNGKRIS